MSISIEEVRKIAKLSRISLSVEEEKRHAETISVVLDYMKMLNEVNVDGVEPTAQVTGLSEIFRDDIVVEYDNKEALKNIWPEKEDGELKVPAVFVGDNDE